MGYWGKVIGGVAGFAMGGPIGAAVGAALGHAADSGVVSSLRLPFVDGAGFSNPARMAALLGHRDQVFAISVVVLSAKLAKCDGAVSRHEIDAFKTVFRVPPESVRDVGTLFDQARENADGYEDFADQLGDSFSDNHGLLEDVLIALFAIARADGSLNRAEATFLARVHRGFRLDQAAWDRIVAGAPRQPLSDDPDPYIVLGVSRSATGEAIRAEWKRLMRENHPDSLASRGVPPDFAARASEKVARMNAAWDRIKRERNL